MQLPHRQRSSINPQYGNAENSSDEQEPRTRTAPRCISVTTPDLMMVPPPRANIGEMDSFFSIGQQQQRSSYDFRGSDEERRDHPSGYDIGLRVSSQDIRSRYDNEKS